MKFIRVNSYQKKLQSEIEWYSGDSVQKRSILQRIIHLNPIFNPSRNSINYRFPKQQMTRLLASIVHKKLPRLLIAPCGSGNDYSYVREFGKEIYGIDLSTIAINRCSDNMILKTGDILHSGYENEYFDIIVASLFFHHLVRIGFDPYLKEFFRILKKGGILIVLDFSLFYPINFFTRPMKRILKNPMKEVEDEDPFNPRSLLISMKRSGFTDNNFQAATFSHSMFYIPIAKIVNYLTFSLLTKWPWKYFGWMVLFRGKKS